MRIRVKNRKRFSKFLSVICAAALVGSALMVMNIASAQLEEKYKEVVVMPGDTLWTIADEHMDGMDVRSAVDVIKKVNGKTSSGVYTGDLIFIPIK